jgi:hypothetical protein
VVERGVVVLRVVVAVVVVAVVVVVDVVVEVVVVVVVVVLLVVAGVNLVVVRFVVAGANLSNWNTVLVISFEMVDSAHSPGYWFEQVAPLGQLLHGLPCLYICPPM